MEGSDVVRCRTLIICDDLACGYKQMILENSRGGSIVKKKKLYPVHANGMRLRAEHRIRSLAGARIHETMLTVKAFKAFKTYAAVQVAT